MGASGGRHRVSDGHQAPQSTRAKVKEIITEQAFLTLLKGFALLTPAAGGLWWLAVRRSPNSRPMSAVAAGAVGPAVLCAWLMYGAVMDAFGLDSLEGIGLNILLFAVIGAAVALLWPRPGARQGHSKAPRER